MTCNRTVFIRVLIIVPSWRSVGTLPDKQRYMIGLKLAPLFHPITSKAEINRDAVAQVFPRFASATCFDWFVVFSMSFVTG